MVARLLSVNVGLPKDISWRGKTVHTAIWKDPVQGRRTVWRLNIDGDGQGDLAGHGGEHRAVMVYQIDSYRYWERHFDRKFPTYGQFGENLTVDGLPDNEVCIGDRYQIGSALLEVTQPRVTCYRVGIRVDEPLMASSARGPSPARLLYASAQEGEIGAGDEIVKVSVGPEQMTVAEIDALLYLPVHSREQLERALKIPALPVGWQASFRALLEQDQGGKALNGNPGLVPDSGPRPAWPGFREVRVSAVNQESKTVFSLFLPPRMANRWPMRVPDSSWFSESALKARFSAIITQLLLIECSRRRSLSRERQRGIHGAVSGYLKRQCASRRLIRRQRSARELHTPAG